MQTESCYFSIACCIPHKGIFPRSLWNSFSKIIVITQVSILRHFCTSLTSVVLALTTGSDIQPILELQRLHFMNCKIEIVYSTSPLSDAEINIATVTIICPQGTTHTIRSYREEASEL
jgi:hypothetical protein